VVVLSFAYRYDWGETNVGLTLAFVGVCSAVVQGALVGPVVARLGERATLLLGLLCGALGMAIYGLSPTGPLFLLGVPTMALWGLSGPAIMGLMSRLVSPSEQGQLQGANTSLSSVAGLIGPGIFAVTFSGLLEQLACAAFDLAALILLGAFAVAWAVTRRRPRAGRPR